MQQSPSRADAERLLGVAAKLLQARDLAGSRNLAASAQEAEPLLDGPDQILAVIDVLLAAEKRVLHGGRHTHDWYAVLQFDRRQSDNLDLLNRQYRRLALLLHPDKNKFPFSDVAFKLVTDAWAVLSYPAKKLAYDSELFRFAKVDIVTTKKHKGTNSSQQKEISAANRGHQSAADEAIPAGEIPSFWTACPYCYHLYEYARVYEGCCLMCQNCERGFEAVKVVKVPPKIPGKDAYYCCLGFFPMGFETRKLDEKSQNKPNIPMAGTAWPENGSAERGFNPTLAGEGFVSVPQGNVAPATGTAIRKRGRPRKIVDPGAPIAVTERRKRGRPRKNVAQL